MELLVALGYITGTSHKQPLNEKNLRIAKLSWFIIT